MTNNQNIDKNIDDKAVKRQIIENYSIIIRIAKLCLEDMTEEPFFDFDDTLFERHEKIELNSFLKARKEFKDAVEDSIEYFAWKKKLLQQFWQLENE